MRRTDRILVSFIVMVVCFFKLYCIVDGGSITAVLEASCRDQGEYGADNAGFNDNFLGTCKVDHLQGLRKQWRNYSRKKKKQLKQKKREGDERRIIGN